LGPFGRDEGRIVECFVTDLERNQKRSRGIFTASASTLIVGTLVGIGIGIGTSPGVHSLADVLSVELFVGIALLGWAMIVLGTVRAVRRMSASRWPLAAVLPVAALAAVALLMTGWIFYSLHLLGAAAYHVVKPRRDLRPDTTL
jgi:O-antigen/teichoic acid export membrane protein